MGQTSENAGLLKILLADDDDANAFLFQCGVNRLGRPCAFQRVNNRAALPAKVVSFQPDILIAAGTFARPDEVKQMKEFTNGHPIICAVESLNDSEAVLSAGAADCVLKSQVDELHACIEWQLNGNHSVPFFKKGLEPETSAKKPKSPSGLDLKLAQFDLWVGAKLRSLAKASALKMRKLARVSRLASQTALRELRRRQTQVKVRWLLYRQKQLVRPTLESGPSEETFAPIARPKAQIASMERDIAPKSSGSVRIISPGKPGPTLPESKPAPDLSDNDTLRTLELSFKTLFHTSLDPMFLLDGLGSFLHANGPACAFLGLTPAALLGKTFLEFVPTCERAQVSALWEALLIEGQQKAEIHLQTVAGESRDVFISARSNLWFGVHLMVVRDQTELKALRTAARPPAVQPQITTPLPVHAALGSLPCEPTQAP